MISIRTISPSDPLYPQACALREEVLLAPIGLDMRCFCELYPGVEESAVHLVALAESPTGSRVVGCVLLVPEEDDAARARLMQMAVHPQRRGEGIGRRLLAEAESLAFSRPGGRELYCHARLGAVPFYERCGWTVEGGLFEEAGIPHRRLAIRDTESPDAFRPG